MRQKKNSFLALISSFLLFLSCQSATVPDQPICVPATLTSGFCRWTISDKRQMVTETSKLKLPDGKEYTWWELKPLMLQMPYTTWKEIKKFIIDVCKVNDMCTEVTHWQRAVDDIDEWMNKNVDPSLSDPCIGVNCNAGKK